MHDTVARLNDADAEAWLRAARRGDLDEAWRLSDRIRARTTSRGDGSAPRHVQQIWDGTPFEGRRVLVRCYHGLGDTIQFARYLPALRAIARDVIVWTPSKLAPLIQTVCGGLAVLPLHDGTPDVDYDVDVEIMELEYPCPLPSSPSLVLTHQPGVTHCRDVSIPRQGCSWLARSLPSPRLAPPSPAWLRIVNRRASPPRLAYWTSRAIFRSRSASYDRWTSPLGLQSTCLQRPAETFA